MQASQIHHKFSRSRTFCFVSFLLFNFLFCVPFIFSFAYLNDDSALVMGAVADIDRNGPWHYFYQSYGPQIIRPFQLFGMYIDAKLFSLNPLPSHFVSLVIFSLAQFVFFLVLRRHIGFLGSFVAAMLPALSIISAEPRYWLSDRHDLYLFFFFALTLLFTSHYLRHALLQNPKTDNTFSRTRHSCSMGRVLQ